MNAERLAMSGRVMAMLTGGLPAVGGASRVALGTLASAGRPVLVVGLGLTGLSVARYLDERDIPFEVIDTRAQPPCLEALLAEMPAAVVRLGALAEHDLLRASCVVLSPGIAPSTAAARRAREAGVPLLGDIELFAREVQAPVLAVTGSNGKSTVVSLLGAMAERAGRRVAVGGNLGPPALDLLKREAVELYVLELSSFQLETTESLAPLGACVLNVSPDHLDRYRDLREYARTKARIYAGGGVMVINADDPVVRGWARPERRVLRFSVAAAPGADFTLLEHAGEPWFARRGEALMPVGQMRLAGLHNAANALAALALGESAGLPSEAMLAALREFGGLPHRCQLVAEAGGVRWYDDSKATNVGASVAALRGVGARHRIVLIAGGLGKGQDFTALGEAAAGRLRAAVLMGRDAQQIARVLRDHTPVHPVASMAEAVACARSLAQPGDAVLLAPACASFDMFRDYVQRGESFAQAVVREIAP